MPMHTSFTNYLLYLRAAVLSGLLLVSAALTAQDFLVVTESSRLYAIDIGNCEATLLSTLQPPFISLTDITFTPDGQLWGVRSSGELYLVNSNTGEQTLQGQLPQGGGAFFTSLVADQNGLIYSVGANGDLSTYDPDTDTPDYLGNVGYGSAGDLTFVDGQLVMAGSSNQMIAINLDNLEDSGPILDFSVGGSIFGIVTFVADCENTVTYASNDSDAGTVFSIDFDTGNLQPVCDVGQVIYGAASELEFLAAAPLVLEDLQSIGSTCAEAAGQLSISVSGGNGGLTYSLDGQNYQAASTFTNLLPGTYTIYVEDDFGCQLEVEAEVEALGSPPAILSVAAEGTVCGEPNGSLLITAGSGTPPYTYSLDGIDFQGNDTFTGLASGTYIATVMDAEGCTAEAEAVVDSSAALQILGVEPDPCQANGTQLSIDATGGTPPYTYELEGFGTQADSLFSGVPGGSYTLMVMDEDGCSDSAVIEVPESTPLPVLSATVEPVSCANEGGAVTVDLVNTDGLQFSLDGTVFSDSPAFEEVAAGNYTLVVRNEAGCTSELPVTVEDLEDAPVLEPVNIRNTTCGEANGRVEAVVSSGTPPFSFQLGNAAPQATGVFEALPPGLYPLTVVDEQGCSVESTVSVGESTPLMLSVSVEACGPGASALRVEANGGSGMGLQYQLGQQGWQASPDFEGLGPGLYNLSAEDSDGCMAAAQATIEEADPLELMLDFVRGCGPGESALRVSGAGGTGPLRYQLNSSAPQSSGLFANLSAGLFRLQVLDTVGCISEELMVEVPEVDPLRLSVQTAEPARCAEDNGRLALAAAGGTPPYAFAVASLAQSTPEFSAIPGGPVPIQVEDQAGCVRSDTIELGVECPIYAPTAFSPNGDGYNDRFVLFSGLPFFVVKYQIYDRWGGLVYEANDFGGAELGAYWDGRYGSEPAGGGQYAYHIEARDGQGLPVLLKGGILLVR